jgi:hypothetical protein
VSRRNVEFPIGGEFITSQLELGTFLWVPRSLVSKGKGRTDITGALDVDRAMFAAIVDLPLKKGLVSDRKTSRQKGVLPAVWGRDEHWGG